MRILLALIRFQAAALVCGFLLFALPAGLRLESSQPVTFSSDRRQIRAVVLAAGDDGHSIRGLTQKHFRVTVDGRDSQISGLTPVARNDQPLAVVLAIDISKSMLGENAFSEARNAAIGLVRELGASDMVAIVSFGNSAKSELTFTADKSRAEKVLEELRPTDDRTVLYEGLLRSTEEATLATTGKAVVIAVTDGKDEGSNVTLEDVVRNAQSNGIALYTLGFGPQEDRKTLARLSELTHGEYRHAIHAGELALLYHSILDELKDAYALKVDTPRLGPGPHDVLITLSYRDHNATLSKELNVPLPRLPAWLWIVSSVMAALLIAFAAMAWLLTRRTRSQSRVLAITAGSPLWVDIVEGSQRGRRVRLSGRRLRLGRAADCELWSDDSSLSPYQAEIVAENGGAALYANSQSKVPTLLNGNRLRPQQSVLLRNGDRIEAGSMVLIFSDQRSAQRSTVKQGDRARAIGASRT